MLLVVGFGTVALSGPAVFDSAGARCHLARAWVDDANTDKKPWNNVDTGGKKAKDLPCPDAIRLVGQIKLKEKGTTTASVPSDTAVRVQAVLAVLMGLGQGISGSMVLRRQSRAARNASIGFSAFGIVLRVLGIVSLAVFGFVAYAFIMSPAAKQIWGRERA